MNIKFNVACYNANGEADFFPCDVTVTQEQFEDGQHINMAEALAAAEGYEAPYVCFLESDFQNIASVVNDLDCPIPFTLKEKAPDAFGEIKGEMSISSDGVSIKLNGYSDYTSQDNGGILTYLELWDGEVFSRVYSDINIEDPTHSIRFENAKNSNRID
ncbi:hypothetical protein V6259_12920 [Marinomonas sp. TI.3.20]|uniref:hypothetical protein n=1 Tax=Marinomonas sp. TI.3.20 TaxID=3121296 RepID=UPI00311D4604